MRKIMAVSLKRIVCPIQQVIVYKGHLKHPLVGPYSETISKRIAMFEALNAFRKRIGRAPWNVSAVAGEQLVDRLKNENPKTTLLVIPAGQSTTLDRVFSTAQTTFMREQFFSKGGRGYFTCGSAYWASSLRIYDDLCEAQPLVRKTVIKPSTLSLFLGVAKGPLCPFPGHKYKTGFFSDAVRVTDGARECTIYLSGGGAFIPAKGLSDHKRVRVLVRYDRNELKRLGKKEEELPAWENAALITSVKEGAALFSMFHPYYGPQDIDVERYEKTFPDCGTNWRRVHERLSPFSQRMNFVLNSMLIPLEDF
jgi:glutamine amidotransferase-like uncharacterized protein